MWYVDVPRFYPGQALELDNPEGLEWVQVGIYNTRAEALAAAKHFFGADEDGKVGLVNGNDSEEVEEP